MNIAFWYYAIRGVPTRSSNPQAYLESGSKPGPPLDLNLLKFEEAAADLLNVKPLGKEQTNAKKANHNKEPEEG